VTRSKGAVGNRSALLELERAEDPFEYFDADD